MGILVETNNALVPFACRVVRWTTRLFKCIAAQETISEDCIENTLVGSVVYRSLDRCVGSRSALAGIAFHSGYMAGRLWIAGRGDRELDSGLRLPQVQQPPRLSPDVPRELVVLLQRNSGTDFHPQGIPEGMISEFSFLIPEATQSERAR